MFAQKCNTFVEHCSTMLVFHVHCQDLRCLMVPVGFMRFSFYFIVLFIHSTLPTNDIVNVAFMYILLTCFTKKFEIVSMQYYVPI